MPCSTRTSTLLDDGLDVLGRDDLTIAKALAFTRLDARNSRPSLKWYAVNWILARRQCPCGKWNISYYIKI